MVRNLMDRGVDLRNPDRDRTVISEYHDGGSSVGVTMVRWEDWKYIHYAEGNPPQLFNLRLDPQEENDLSLRRIDIIEEAQSRLAEFMDVEAVNEQVHSEQIQKLNDMGGYDLVSLMKQWNYTPVR